MRVPRALLLLIPVAGLGAFVYFYELPRARQEGKKDKLLAVDREAVTGIALTYADREIVLRRDEQGWRLVKPADAPADDAAVKSLLSTLADAEVQRTLEDVPQDLSEYGLDTPTVTARLTLKDGSQTPPIAVGKNTPVGGKTYVRKGDEPKLYLTSSSLGFGLNKQAKDLREKVLLAFQDDDVTRVEIKREGGETTTLVRKDKDAWTVDPGGHPADATEVRSYLSSLRATRATDFPDDAPADLAKYGLNAPRLALTVVTGKEGNETTKSLLLGAESVQGTQKQVYAKRGDQPAVYALGDWSFRTLGKTAAQFRDKTVLGFDPARVGKLAITRKDGEALHLARAEGGGWKIEGADAEQAKADVVTRYLEDLRELRGADVVAEPARELAPYGLDAPDLRVVLTDKEGQPMGAVRAAKRDAKYYAMRADGDTVFEVRDYMFTRLDKRRADFVAPGPAAGGTTTTAPFAAEEAPGGDEEDEEPLPDEEEEPLIDDDEEE